MSVNKIRQRMIQRQRTMGPVESEAPAPPPADSPGGYLILTRKLWQVVNVYAADGSLLLQVTVNDISPTRVRIGFLADRSVRILRGELGEVDQEKGAVSE